MRYIFMALHAEAAPLIRQWNLKQTDGPIRCFKCEDTILALTGTGPLSASAVCGAILSAHSVTERDLVLNAGFAASVTGAEKGQAYVVHKAKDCSSGRDYYPDLIPPSSLPEAELYSGSTLYSGNRGSLPSFFSNTVLYDMEGAAILHSAGLFVHPHQVRLLKVVTDFGERPAPSILQQAALTLAEAAENECRIMQEYLDAAPVPQNDPIIPADAFHASLTMTRKLKQVLHWCRTAGIDPLPVYEQMVQDGRLPAPDKQSGKEHLEEFIHELLP